MNTNLRTSLESTLLNQKTRFLLNVEALFRSNDPEVIHQIRLSLKMIRSIMGFLGYVSPSHDFTRKYITRLNKTFYLCGKLRDEQVLLENLRHLQAAFGKNFKQYEKHLKANIDENKQSLCARLEKKRNSFMDKLFLDFFAFLYSRTDKEIFASYHVYLDERYSSLQNSFKKHPVTNSFLHNIRKQLKDYIHLLTFLPERQSPGMIPSLESFKKLDNELGTWHDLVNTYESLKTFLDKKPELMEKKAAYGHLLLFLKKEIQLSRKTITKMIEELSVHSQIEQF